MNCTQCGAVLPDGARFCGQCGAPVAAAAVPAAALDAPVVTSAVFAPPQGAPGAAPAGGPVEAPGASDGTLDGAPVPFDGTPPASRGSGRRWLIAGCAVLALAVAGVVAWLVLRSDETAAGGAGSPEDVASGFAEAMSNEDLLAAAAYMSPLETPGLEQLLTTLRDAAKEQGIAGLSAGDGLDVQLDLRPDRVTELADGIARVELSMDLSIEGTPTGPVGELLADGSVRIDERDVEDALRADAFSVVVVRESGRWYVSPMLTAGEYAADALDLPSPRYDQAEAPEDERTATDEEGAVELVGDAIEERDASLAAGAFAPGEARFVRVFGRAIDDLLDRWDGDISFESLAMSEVDTDRWSIDHVEVSAQPADAYSVSGVQLDDDCALWVHDLDVDEICLHDLDWLTDPLDPERVVLHTSNDGSTAHIELMATVIDDLGQLATRVTRLTLLEALDLELLETPEPLTVDEPLTLSFTGDEYHVVEWIAADDRWYLLESEGDIGMDAELYVDDGDGGWSWMDWAEEDGTVITPQDAGRRIRAVVRSGVDCSDDCTREDGELVLHVRRLQLIDASVGTVVKPLLGPGVSVLLDIDADDLHRYEVTTETPGVELRSVEFGSVYELSRDDDGYVPGPYADTLQILVTNTGTEEVRAEVALREHDLADEGGGEIPSGEGVSLDFAEGRATYDFEVADASSITVTAVPEDGQDLVLDVEPCDFCFADSGYAGDSETTTFAPDGETSFTVTVTGFTEDDAFGTVTVYVDVS